MNRGAVIPFPRRERAEVEKILGRLEWRANWWGDLEKIDRRYLCHAAGVAPGLAAKDWMQLSIVERAKVATAAEGAIGRLDDARRLLPDSPA